MIRNPSLVIAGDSPGEAWAWTLSARASLESIATFGPDVVETFERWYRRLGTLERASIVRATFSDNRLAEDFERGWEALET
jgi:hypothetical protein